MDKFKKIMVGFFILASVNVVSINCFAVKSKNKPNKIVKIKSDVNQLKGKRITRNGVKRERKNKQKKIIDIKSDANQLKGKRTTRNDAKQEIKNKPNKIIDIKSDENQLKEKKTRNGVKRERKNKPNKIVKIKSDANQLSSNIKINTNMQDMLKKKRKRSNVKQKEKNYNIKSDKKNFNLIGRKDGISDTKRTVEEIKLNMLKYLSVSLFYEIIEDEKIKSIFEKNNINNYSNFYFYCKKANNYKSNNYKYYLKIITPNLEEVDDIVKENIKTQIEEYFNSLREDVFCSTLITKLKAIKKQDIEYKRLISFFVKRTKERFYIDNGQNINSVIKYIFNGLKEEKDYSKYLEILKKEDIKLTSVNFYNDCEYKDDAKKERKPIKYDDATIIKLNILNFLAKDLIKEKFKKQDIEDIFTKNNAKGYKDFYISLKKFRKNMVNILEILKPKEEVELNKETKNEILKSKEKVELNKETKNEISKQIKEYFNGIKDDVLGDGLIENLKKLEINSFKYNKMKASLEDTIKRYFSKDVNVNFENIFNSLKNETDYSGYLKILKEFDLVRYVEFKKDKVHGNKKRDCNVKTMKINMLKILAKDEFKNCLESFFKEYNIKECKDIEISTNRTIKDVIYHLHLNIPKFKKIDLDSKKEIIEYLKDCFNKGKKEIFKKVSKNLKNIDTKGEEYNNMINILKKIWKKYFIIKDGQNVKEMLEDIFNNLKEEKNYDDYLTFINNHEILSTVNFSDIKKKKNIKEDVEEDEEEGDEESDEEENVEEENIEKSNKEENMEEENVEKIDEEEGNKYKRLRAMNEYKNTYPLNYLNDVNEFVKIMKGLKEYNIISDKNDLKEKELDENGGYLEENILKEKTNENFNFNPNKIIYNKYEKDFNLNDNDNNDNNDNILYKIFK